MVHKPAALPIQRSFITETLFQKEKEILIIHGDDTYRLRITKQNKLILNK